MLTFRMLTKTIIENITQNKDTLPFDVKAVAIFGSWAKNKATESSDIDMLVIVNNFKGKWNRQQATVQLKNIFNELPVELLVYAVNEAAENFQAHNPLFLDIASDAKIILDTNDFLKNLAAETCQYIKNSPLKRLDDGWKMQVRKGAVTYLSPISNKDLAYAWLEEAKRDLEAAKTLLNGKLLEKSVYHSQQTVEKSLKAILSAVGYYKKSHFVSAEILKAAKEVNPSVPWDKELKSIAKLAANIEPEVTLARYPRIENGKIVSPSNEYTENKAADFLSVADTILHKANNFLTWWFS